MANLHGGFVFGLVVDRADLRSMPSGTRNGKLAQGAGALRWEEFHAHWTGDGAER